MVVIRSFFVGCLSWLLSVFLYSPRLTLFLGAGSGSTRRDDLLTQCVDPLARNLNEPILAYRIVQPLLAHALGWCGDRRDLAALLGSPGIAYLALILTLACCHWALRQRFSSAVSLLTTLALATTMVTQWTNTAWGHPDSLTLLPIALMLISRHPLLVTACVFIGFLNDERLVLAIPFLVLWWWPEAESWKKSLSKFLAPGLAVCLGLGFVLLVRVVLAQGLIGPGIDDAYRSGGLFSGPFSRIWQPNEWPGLAVMVLLGFRWLWLIPLFAVSFLWRQRGAFRILIYALSLSAASLSTFTVADVSRSFAFVFPCIIVGLQILKENGWSDRRLSNWLAWCLGLNILTPAAKVFGLPQQWWRNPLSWASPYLPLPINVWQWLRSPNGAATW
jgi:hypothetical protein